jgi:hypothetical protein
LAVVSLTTGVSFATFKSDVASYSNDAFRMPAFFAALPMSTGDFAWAKLGAASRRMTFVAAIVTATIACIAAVTGLRGSLGAMLAVLAERVGTFEASMLAAAGLAAFVALAAAVSANVVWVTLLGRRWKAVNTVIVLLAVAVLPLSVWINTAPNVLAVASAALPIAAGVKLGGLALLMRRVQSLGLYERSRILAIGAGWTAVVAAGFAAYLRYAPDGGIGAVTVLSGLVVLVPVLGIVAAPLALRANRAR